MERDLSSSVRTSILMAIIDLESKINQFCFFNLGEITTDSIERLSLLEKLEVAHSVLGLSSFKGSRPYQVVRAMVNWRNAFVHGKCTDMPYNKIRDNHLKEPKKLLESPDEIKEMLEMLNGYILACKYLSKISKHSYTRGHNIELDYIGELIDDIKKYKFDSATGWVIDIEGLKVDD